MNYASSARRQPLSGYASTGSTLNGFLMLMGDGRTPLVDRYAADAGNRVGGRCGRGGVTVAERTSFRGYAGWFSLCSDDFTTNTNTHTRAFQHTHTRARARTYVHSRTRNRYYYIMLALIGVMGGVFPPVATVPTPHRKTRSLAFTELGTAVPIPRRRRVHSRPTTHRSSSTRSSRSRFPVNDIAGVNRSARLMSARVP